MGDSICQQCGGKRYLIDRSGLFSTARLCRCAAQCPACEGSGRQFLTKDGYSYAKPCPCRSIATRVTRFTQARLPARCGLSFEDYVPQNGDQQTAKAVAQTTAMRYRPDAPSRGFIVAGPVGSGKTHLLCATLSYLTLEVGITARYVEISFLFAEIRKGFAEKRSGLEAIQPLVETDVLAIDELGKGRGSEFEQDTLDELIARRYNANRTTLIATNYSLRDQVSGPAGYVDPSQHWGEKRPGQTLLRDRVGERVFSRLYEMCHPVELPQTTPDYRRLERR